MNRPNLRTITTALVALLVPTTMLVSASVAAYFKSNNPDNVDITQGLAYLQQSMIAAIITFTILVAIIVTLIVKMYKNDGNFSNAKLPLTMLIATSILLGGFGLVNAYTNKVQDQYLIDNGRPTLNQFFDKVEENKNR